MIIDNFIIYIYYVYVLIFSYGDDGSEKQNFGKHYRLLHFRNGWDRAGIVSKLAEILANVSSSGVRSGSVNSSSTFANTGIRQVSLI